MASTESRRSSPRALSTCSWASARSPPSRRSSSSSSIVPWSIVSGVRSSCEAVATNERRAVSWRRSSSCMRPSARARSPTSSRPRSVGRGRLRAFGGDPQRRALQALEAARQRAREREPEPDRHGEADRGGGEERVADEPDRRRDLGQVALRRRRRRRRRCRRRAASRTSARRRSICVSGAFVAQRLDREPQRALVGATLEVGVEQERRARRRRVSVKLRSVTSTRAPLVRSRRSNAGVVSVASAVGAALAPACLGVLRRRACRSASAGSCSSARRRSPSASSSVGVLQRGRALVAQPRLQRAERDRGRDDQRDRTRGHEGEQQPPAQPSQCGPDHASRKR